VTLLDHQLRDQMGEQPLTISFDGLSNWALILNAYPTVMHAETY